MKIKDPIQKKRVVDRLRRIEGQIRGVVQMIEEEAGVKEIIQQMAAVRSALGQAANEEIITAFERLAEKKSVITPEDLDEMRVFLKTIR